MVNKKTIIVMGMIFLVVFVTAQILLTRNVDVEFTKNETDTLARYNITSPETTQLICDDEVCKYSMYQIYYENRSRIVVNDSVDPPVETTEYYLKEVRYNLGSHTFTRQELSQVQLEAKQEEQIKEWLENYAGILKEREDSVTIKEVVSNSTTITIKGKK